MELKVCLLVCQSSVHYSGVQACMWRVSLCVCVTDWQHPHTAAMYSNIGFPGLYSFNENIFAIYSKMYF